jgi:ribosome-binding factor A
MNLRLQRINRQLQKDLAQIIREQGMAHYGGAMLSVTEVDAAPNLATAKVYVSVFPSSMSGMALGQLNAKAMRAALAMRTKKQMRTVPELSFVADTTLDYAQRIDELLRGE